MRKPRDFEEIRVLALDLQRRRSPLIQKMLEVQTMYDADVVIPLPDVKGEPNMPDLTPQLMSDVIDGLARRASSVRPMVFSPAKNAYDADSKKLALDRVRMLNAVYGESGWVLKRRRKSRHENAYETSTVVVTIDSHRQMPILELRSPLETYPEERAIESERPPSYVAFINRYSGDYLRARFPMCCSEYGGPISTEDTGQMWDVFEWYDDDIIQMGLLGPALLDGEHIHQGSAYNLYGGPWMPLTDPVENKAGKCLAFAPHGVTLHRIGNRLNRLIENINWQNRLMALEVLATEKSVFPDMYVMSGSRGLQPTLADGEWQDGRTGRMNMISNADSIGALNVQPSQGSSLVRRELQQAFMNTSGLRPQMYGEAGSINFRTGAALSASAEMSIDPIIQELHEMDEAWMPRVNECILASFEGWWPSKKYTMFSRWPGDDGELEFVPNKTVEGVHHNSVEYAIAGADVVQLTQILGSMLGAKVISTETFQMYHPHIRNPQLEKTKIETEELDRAMMEGLQQQVVSGQLPVAVFARIRKLYSEGDMPLVDVIVQVDEEIREQQAAAQEAAMAEQQAQPAMTPEAMMGLAAGPAAAAPGAVPPNPAGPAQLPAAGGPVAQMREMLTRANPAGV